VRGYYPFLADSREIIYEVSGECVSAVAETHEPAKEECVELWGPPSHGLGVLRMAGQDDSLAREDGRYFAIDKCETGVVLIATSERISGNVVSFGLPFGPALFLHLAHRAFTKLKGVEPLTLFDRHSQGIWPDDQGPLFDFFEDFIAHVTFVYTAIEAFANEVLPRDFRYTFKLKKTGEERIYDKHEIERNVNLDEKLHLVLPPIVGVASPKGTRVWERYKTIKKLRDRIIHLKSVDQRRSGPEDQTIWGSMLRLYKEPFCDHAHAMLGHFKPARCYFLKYPYSG
jgi:hypothetical protein